MFSDYSSGRGASTSSYREESPRLLPRSSRRSFSPSNYTSSSYNRKYNSEAYPVSNTPSNSSVHSEKLPPRVPQEYRRSKRPYSQTSPEDRYGFQPKSMSKLRVIGRDSRERSESLEPRRYYPQSSSNGDLSDLDDKDDSSIVLDANLSFVLGCKTRMRQNVKPLPAYQEEGTANNALASKIKNFLRRTDHVMDEWRKGKKRGGRSRREIEEERDELSKSRSERNIMIKSLKIYSRSSSVARSSSRISDDTLTECGDATFAEFDEVIICEWKKTVMMNYS